MQWRHNQITPKKWKNNVNTKTTWAFWLRVWTAVQSVSHFSQWTFMHFTIQIFFIIFYSWTESVEKRWMDSYNFFMQMVVRCLMLSKFFIFAFYVVWADGKWWSLIIVGCRIKIRRTLSWLEVKFKSFLQNLIDKNSHLTGFQVAGVGHSYIHTYLLCNEINSCKQCLNSHSIWKFCAKSI